MEYPYFKGLEADRYSFYRVPKALVKADLFQKMSGDAKLLYAVLLDRMSLSIKNGWQDKHGNAYIICMIEEVMDSIHCARQKAVKLPDELEQEFRLIERRRQGLGKPNLLYVKDLYAGLSQSNYWKYENHTSGGLKTELPGVPKSNGSKPFLRSWYCVTCLRRIVSHRGVKSIKAVTTFACKKLFFTFHYTGWVCKWILWRYPQCGIISKIESLQIVFAHVMTLIIML